MKWIRIAEEMPKEDGTYNGRTLEGECCLVRIEKGELRDVYFSNKSIITGARAILLTYWLKYD